MADYTEIYNLILPNETENYDIEIANTNNKIIDNALKNKVERIIGKDLSTNDFTDGYKRKVDRLAEATRGYSAYEIAVQNGFEGTEEEWLISLKGEKGDTGPSYDDTEVKKELSAKADLVDGLIPASQLPSFVDDVLEYATLEDFPEVGENGKIYIATDTNFTYRWGGTNYVATNSSLALGETESTAYRGDRGKIAYEHSQQTHAPTTIATQEADGLMSKEDKIRLDGKLDKTGGLVDDLVVGAISSKNLFNKNNIVKNYYLGYTDGTPTWDSNMAYMNDFVEVKPNAQYTMSNSTATIFIIHQYDENKNFIEYNMQNDSNTSYTITTKANVKYVRLSCGKNYIENMQFEKGAVATELTKHYDFNYSKSITTGEEFETGRIIDGKKEYGKRINCGNLPKTSTITVDTGLSNVTYLNWEGIVVGTDGSSGYPYKMDNSGSGIILWISGNQINVRTPSDGYATYIGYVTIYYLKN